MDAYSLDYLQRLSRLPILTDEVEISHRQEVIMALGRQFQLTAYGASYLELALRSGSTLATFDTKLVAAMRQADGRISPERR